MFNITIIMTDKKTKMKNPCKVCSKPVTDKTGRRCEGVCRKWIHFNCLNYAPDKIDAIKRGIIKINCPCPNCESNNMKKEKHTNQKNVGTISGICGKANCPAVGKIDSELKCFSVQPPGECKDRKGYEDAVTMIEDFSLLFNPSEDKTVTTNSSVEKLVLTMSRAESPPREHRRTSPMRAHQSTCVSPYDILLGYPKGSLLNPVVHVATSPTLFPCSESCTSLCSLSRSQNTSMHATKDQSTDVTIDGRNRLNRPPEDTSNIKCPYCMTKVILGGIPKRIYKHIQQQKQNNYVVECSDSECDVTPCFEYKNNKNYNEPTMTQKMIDRCMKRAKEVAKTTMHNVSSVTSMTTSLSPKSEQNQSSCGEATEILSQDCEKDNTVQNALGTLLNRLYENMEEMQNQFKVLMHYFNCPSCGH